MLARTAAEGEPDLEFNVGQSQPAKTLPGVTSVMGHPLCPLVSRARLHIAMQKEILTGLGRVSMMVLMVATIGCGSSQQCPKSCPATYVHVTLVVTSSPDGGAISDVGVAFSGPSTGTMSCERRDTETICFWPSGPVTEGTYLLDVVAPGYLERKVNSELVVIPDPVCGCTGATLNPFQVTLSSL
jgi:hypothetical protein